MMYLTKFINTNTIFCVCLMYLRYYTKSDEKLCVNYTKCVDVLIIHNIFTLRYQPNLAITRGKEIEVNYESIVATLA